MPLKVPCLAALLLCWGSSAVGEPQSEESANTETDVQLDAFVGPTGVSYVQPVYPKNQQLDGFEGWVNLSLMVAPDGSPYEVAVSDSTGVGAFERAALRAIEKSRFKPATLNGEPIDAGMHVKVKFELEGIEVGARPGFANVYKRLNVAVRNQDQQQADAQLDELAKLSVHNLYEDAYLNLGRYTYFTRWGTREQQLGALTRAIAHEDREGYLPAEQFESALLTSFKLQVALQDFGGAMRTWHKLQELDLDPEQVAQGQSVVDRLLVLQNDDRAYSVTGTIGTNASWFYSLFKRNFEIDVIDGELAEFKLRCDRSYAFSRYDPELRYKVSENDGNCHLEIVGNPGTQFVLTQS